MNIRWRDKVTNFCNMQRCTSDDSTKQQTFEMAGTHDMITVVFLSRFCMVNFWPEGGHMADLNWDTVSHHYVREERLMWRATLHKVTVSFEEEIRIKLKRCKHAETGTHSTNSVFCFCSQQCRSNIGRVSHKRSCSARWCLAKPTTVDSCLLQNCLLKQKVAIRYMLMFCSLTVPITGTLWKLSLESLQVFHMHVSGFCFGVFTCSSFYFSYSLRLSLFRIW